jgi:hypothetical protein
MLGVVPYPTVVGMNALAPGPCKATVPAEVPLLSGPHC